MISLIIFLKPKSIDCGSKHCSSFNLNWVEWKCEKRINMLILTSHHLQISIKYKFTHSYSKCCSDSSLMSNIQQANLWCLANKSMMMVRDKRTEGKPSSLFQCHGFAGPPFWWCQSQCLAGLLSPSSSEVSGCFLSPHLCSGMTGLSSRDRWYPGGHVGHPNSESLDWGWNMHQWFRLTTFKVTLELQRCSIFMRP